MDDPNTFRTPKRKGSSAPRYRVTPRGDVPANLVDVVSSAHAAALAQTTATAPALGNDHSTLELGQQGDADAGAADSPKGE